MASHHQPRPHHEAERASGSHARRHQNATAAGADRPCVRGPVYGPGGCAEEYASIGLPVPALGYTG
eukprot:7133766-Alexandrium_andersonii.AAC.1